MLKPQFINGVLFFALFLWSWCLPTPVAAAVHQHGAQSKASSLHHHTHSTKSQGLNGSIHESVPHQKKSHKFCAHGSSCLMNGLCSLTRHQCHYGEKGMSSQICFVATECGGGDETRAELKSGFREFIAGFFQLKKPMFSYFLLPPPKEFSVASISGDLERPPQSTVS